MQLTAKAQGTQRDEHLCHFEPNESKPVFVTRGRDDRVEIWIHKGFCEGVE